MRGLKLSFLGSDPSAARKLRVELRSWLLGAGVIGAMGSDITSAANEAFVNAVEHPLDRVTEEVVVDGEVTAREIVIRIRDDGAWSDKVDPDRRHYGYTLLETLMDTVEVARSSSGTVVTLRRMLRSEVAETAASR